MDQPERPAAEPAERRTQHGSQEELDEARAPEMPAVRRRTAQERRVQLATYIDLAEYEACEQKALEAGVTLSAWARRALKKALMSE